MSTIKRFSFWVVSMKVISANERKLAVQPLPLCCLQDLLFNIPFFDNGPASPIGYSVVNYFSALLAIFAVKPPISIFRA
jgi:hypothetical protein